MLYFQSFSFKSLPIILNSKFVKGKSEIFANLSTGFGKSLISVFDSLTASSGHLVVVGLPVVDLMKDQMRYLRCTGSSPVGISDLQDENSKKLEKWPFLPFQLCLEFPSRGWKIKGREKKGLRTDQTRSPFLVISLTRKS